MARKHLSHIKSKLTENGGPKLPTSSQLIEGEIAVNFAKGYETLSILNSDSGITTFSNDVTIMSYIDEQDLEIVNGAGLSVVSNSQTPGVSNYQYVADSADTILSGATSLKDADSLLSQTILDNEVVIAEAINELQGNKLDASAYTPTDLSNYYNKQGVDAALSGKQDVLVSEVNIKSINGETLIGSGSVDADDVVMGKLENDEFYKVVSYSNFASDPVFDTNPVSKSEALNHEKIYVDILTNKAYRIKKSVQFGAIQFYELGVTDLSNYYNKTEIDTALSGKQDTLIAGTGISISSGNVISTTIELTEFVSELPAQGEPGKIYFVPDTDSQDPGNAFKEYAWTSGGTWELMGEWKPDITIDSALSSGSSNPVANSAITLALNTISAATDDTFVIECSGSTIPTTYSRTGNPLTITNGVTLQDVIDAYEAGKKIAVKFEYYVNNVLSSTIYSELDATSYDSSAQRIGLIGKAPADVVSDFWDTQSDIEFFVTNIYSNSLEVRVKGYLSARAEINYTDEIANLVFPGEVVSGTEFKPAFRFSGSSISPVVAYLDDLDELIDDVKVDAEYFSTNGTNSFAASNKRYNIVDVLELESGATYNVGSGSTLHFWNGGALSGDTGDTAILGIKDTLITGPMHKIFGDNVTFGGTMRNAECYPEWFGALGDGVTDDSAAINRCIYNAGYTPVVLNAMAYYVESSIVMAESGFNSLINTQLGYSIASWGRNQQFIAKHNIIGAPTLDGPVLIVESNGSICRVNGVIAVQNSGDSAVGFSTIKPSGADSGNQDMNIYIHGIQKGPKGDWYEGATTVDSYVAQWGVGHGTGAVLASYGGFIVIDYIQGFERGVNLCRFYDTQLHIGQCEAIYCLYLGPSYNLGSTGYFVCRNKIFVGSQVKTQNSYCKYIVNAAHSSMVREIGSIEIAMNEITFGDSNGPANRRHPHKHSLYYTAGAGGHTGNKYNFNVTYGVETTRTFVKYEYDSAQTATSQGCGDEINFGVSCYLKDIDMPYGWNVKLNNVLVNNSAQSIGSYRWFGGSGEMLIDTVTITKESTPVWNSGSTTIKLLDINPQHKGNVIATDTVPTTCENGKFYVVDNSTVTITTNGTKKYPVYAKYFGTDATLIGYSLDSYKEYQEALTFDLVPTSGSTNPVESNGIYDALEEKQDVLSAGTGIDITDNVVSSTLVIDSALDSGSTNPVQNSAITISLNEIEEVVGASLWDLNAKTVDNKRAISALTESLSGMQDCITTTYDELKTMRDGGTLSPGVWYRITDYQCTTTQENTQSAGHQFDILVLATDTDKLSEEARAVNHSGDTYFANSNLNAWKIWYCLDNDTSRFAWADGGGLIPDTLVVTQDDEEVSYIRRNGTKTVNGVTYYMWKLPEGLLTPNYLTEKEFPTEGDVFYSYTQAGVSLPPTAIGTVNSFIPEHIEEGNGRGVIYRLIDEFNNDIKYDFKNILFNRPLTNGQYDTGGTDTWVYTFNYWGGDDIFDASIVGNSLADMEMMVIGVHNNEIGVTTMFDIGESTDSLTFVLPNDVVLTYSDEGYEGCCDNIIGNGSYSNTFGCGFRYNVIGEKCYGNVVGDSCMNNHIGYGFRINTIDYYFRENEILNSFYDNTIGYSFENNIIGNGVYNSTIGNNVSKNIIGNNSILYVGNYFTNNTIGNSVKFIGGSSVSNKTNYIRNIQIESGVEFVDLTTTGTTNSSNYLQNITIKSGVVGTSASHKVITHPTVNDTFHTTYQPANSQVISV